jgi:hypothetical protein
MAHCIVAVLEIYDSRSIMCRSIKLNQAAIDSARAVPPMPRRLSRNAIADDCRLRGFTVPYGRYRTIVFIEDDPSDHMTCPPIHTCQNTPIPSSLVVTFSSATVRRFLHESFSRGTSRVNTTAHVRDTPEKYGTHPVCAECPSCDGVHSVHGPARNIEKISGSLHYPRHGHSF